MILRIIFKMTGEVRDSKQPIATCRCAACLMQRVPSRTSNKKAKNNSTRIRYLVREQLRIFLSLMIGSTS